MQICLSPGRETENLFGVALRMLSMVPALKPGRVNRVTFSPCFTNYPGSDLDWIT